MGPLGSISSTISIPFALPGQGKADGELLQRHSTDSAGAGKSQPGWKTLCYSLELVLARGKCPSSEKGGLGSTMLQTRGGFDFSSCRGIRFLENPLPRSSNFVLKQLLLTHLPTPAKLPLASIGEQARLIAGFEGKQKVSDC